MFLRQYQVTSWFYLAFYVALLLSPPACLHAETIEDLAAEAHDFAAQQAGTSDPAQARLLWQAAMLMYQEGHCDLAQDLVLQALRRTREPDSTHWATIMAAALCARDWKSASDAAYLALELAQDKSGQTQALSTLIHAMERGQRIKRWQTGTRAWEAA